LDVNVLISAVISKQGPPARLLGLWKAGAFELLVSPALLSELDRALAYPKLARSIDPADAARFLAWVSRSGSIQSDPEEPGPARSVDPGDDYLLALAFSRRAALVSGDAHLLALKGKFPVYAPAEFLARLESEGTAGDRSEG
jgi:uncharacterized protein